MVHEGFDLEIAFLLVKELQRLEFRFLINA